MRNRKKQQRVPGFFLIALSLAVGVGLGLLAISLLGEPKPEVPETQATARPAERVGIETRPSQDSPQAQTAPSALPTPEPTPETEMPLPAPIDGTRPSDFGFETKISVDGAEVGAYTRPESIHFGAPDGYTALAGVTTFRGNNYRNMSSFGTVEVTQKKLSLVWETNTSGMARWTGSGWTGQPILVQWPEETRRQMNLEPDKKNKDGLVEVIYALMDGYAYFLDLADGKPTRPKLKIDVYQSRGNNYDRDHMGGFTVDSRGYPLLYVGSGGDDTPGKKADSRFCIYSLIDQQLLYEFGRKNKFAFRNWTGWDCAPLVDTGTDTLITCGEDGVIYTVKLNSHYDPAAGTVSIAPSDMVQMAYTTERSRKHGIKKFWLGIESSSVIWKHFLYVADNGGHLMCVDLNTMQVVWVQDTLDDTNSTPVLEIEPDGRGYLYISTSFHGGWRAAMDKTAPIPIWKIDASTGEVIWRTDYTCYTAEGISGGSQATALVGQGNISDLVIMPLARTPGKGTGLLVALDKQTGREVWNFDLGGFTWSSTAAIYTEDGTAYLIQCNTNGWMYLLDGKTGVLLDKIRLGEKAIESTPAAFGDMIVVGTRGQKIYGVRIT
ncbi:MAG: PQQ-binding-like beta-propeller repeat protein [Clostridiales bacterium]|nr:PQQ-binding-like beta-propeller repeat protein [Clostridiales bacterium]